MSDILNTSAKKALDTARVLQDQGSVPLFLGIHGLLALMHRMIGEYITNPKEEKLRFLVAYGIHALGLLVEDREFEDLIADEDSIEDNIEYADMDGTEEDEPRPQGETHLATPEGHLANDSRFTRIQPGTTVKEVKNARKKGKEEKEEDTEESS